MDKFIDIINNESASFDEIESAITVLTMRRENFDWQEQTYKAKSEAALNNKNFVTGILKLLYLKKQKLKPNETKKE